MRKANHGSAYTKVQQAAGELAFPSFFGLIPWMHHVLIITKCKSIEEALFYIEKTIKENPSRNALENCIRADLYHNSGAAVTSFAETLPDAQGKLAKDLLKGNYDFGFVQLAEEHNEFELEDALEKRMTRFLLELGQGWAFVGRQKELIISGKSRRIDLLFYHIRLRCYVVLELKAKPFEPEFAGKLNFYVNAIDAYLRDPSDNHGESQPLGIYYKRTAKGHIDISVNGCIMVNGDNEYGFRRISGKNGHVGICLV